MGDMMSVVVDVWERRLETTDAVSEPPLVVRRRRVKGDLVAVLEPSMTAWEHGTSLTRKVPMIGAEGRVAAGVAGAEVMVATGGETEATGEPMAETGAVTDMGGVWTAISVTTIAGLNMSMSRRALDDMLL
jgi:hypothetical protein